MSQLNNDSLLLFVDDILRQRQIAVEKFNKMFGRNIKVSFVSNLEAENTQGGNGNVTTD